MWEFDQTTFWSFFALSFTIIERAKKRLDFFPAQNMSNSGRKHINVGLFQTHISFSPYLRDIKKSCVVGGLKSVQKEIKG